LPFAGTALRQVPLALPSHAPGSARAARTGCIGTNLDNVDPYQVLGISRAATPAEIRRAYRTLVFRFHPDRSGEDPQAREKFEAVQDAYDLLRSHPHALECEHRAQAQERTSEPLAPAAETASPGTYAALLTNEVGPLFWMYWSGGMALGLAMVARWMGVSMWSALAVLPLFGFLLIIYMGAIGVAALALEGWTFELAYRIRCRCAARSLTRLPRGGSASSPNDVIRAAGAQGLVTGRWDA
jgi:hypothetical protein